MNNDVSGVILAGGKSIRMGLEKPFLTVKNKRIVDIALDIFKSIFDEILIVTDNKNRFFEFKAEKVGVVEDLVKARGPLGGIYTGLKTISNDRAFFIACDMPLLRNDFIKRLLDISAADEYDCIIPYTSRGIEPLHAIYSRKILPTIEDLLIGTDLSIRQLLKRCNCRYIKVENEVGDSFFNVNTPRDLKKLFPNG